jgi:hypothetical protein
METYNFQVLLDATTKEVRIEGIAGAAFPLRAPQGISLITFALDPDAVAAGATFPSTPIQWLQNGGEPTDLPPWFVMHWHDTGHFALWDFNSAPSESQHDFVLSVYDQGQFYSSHDPVIINEPPSG